MTNFKILARSRWTFVRKLRFRNVRIARFEKKSWNTASNWRAGSWI